MAENIQAENELDLCFTYLAPFPDRLNSDINPFRNPEINIMIDENYGLIQ